MEFCGGCFMNKLFQKNEIWFAIVFIIIYVVGSSVADVISASIGITKLITLAFDIVLSLCLFLFIKNNHLNRYFGLCRPQYPAARFLYYFPLIVLASVNIWFGVQMNMPVADAICYVGSMLFVGFLEELIFRGLLFNAMRKDNVETAIIVTSILFGIGHIVNLFNGRGMELVANICQVVYAAAIGFLFVTIFYKGGSLWPCIITHSIVNAMSTFANDTVAARYQIPIAMVMVVIAMAYALILWRTIPATQKSTCDK